MAAGRNQTGSIRKLFELRSNKKLPPLGGNPVLAQDVENRNAIHDAAAKGYVGPIGALVEFKADIDNQDNLEGKRPIHRCAEGRHTDCLRAMLDLKCDLNGKDYDKETALHKVIFNSDEPHCNAV